LISEDGCCENVAKKVFLDKIHVVIIVRWCGTGDFGALQCAITGIAFKLDFLSAG